MRNPASPYPPARDLYDWSRMAVPPHGRDEQDFQGFPLALRGTTTEMMLRTAVLARTILDDADAPQILISFTEKDCAAMAGAFVLLTNLLPQTPFSPTIRADMQRAKDGVEKVADYLHAYTSALRMTEDAASTRAEWTLETLQRCLRSRDISTLMSLYGTQTGLSGVEKKDAGNVVPINEALHQRRLVTSFTLAYNGKNPGDLEDLFTWLDRPDELVDAERAMAHGFTIRQNLKTIRALDQMLAGLQPVLQPRMAQVIPLRQRSAEP